MTAQLSYLLSVSPQLAFSFPSLEALLANYTAMLDEGFSVEHFSMRTPDGRQLGAQELLELEDSLWT